MQSQKSIQLDLGNVRLKETLVLQNLDVQVVTAEGLTVAKHMMFLPVTTIRKSLDLSSAEMQRLNGDLPSRFSFPKSSTLTALCLEASLLFASLQREQSNCKRGQQFESGPQGLRAGFSRAGGVLRTRLLAVRVVAEDRGQSDKADAVYFAMRDRRRYTEFLDANTLWQKTVAGFNYVIGFGHKWLFGYGRGWVYPLIWSVLFVIAGAFIFRTEHMQKVDQQTPRNFSPIWYSIDIFVPVLSLGIAKDWHPRQECRALQFYSKFLSLIGLIFISAMIGALTGSLK